MQRTEPHDYHCQDSIDKEADTLKLELKGTASLSEAFKSAMPMLAQFLPKSPMPFPMRQESTPDVDGVLSDLEKAFDSIDKEPA